MRNSNFPRRLVSLTALCLSIPLAVNAAPFFDVRDLGPVGKIYPINQDISEEQIYRINDNALIIGTAEIDIGNNVIAERAVYSDAGAAFAPLPIDPSVVPADQQNAARTAAYDVNADGLVVGSIREPAGAIHPSVWQRDAQGQWVQTILEVPNGWSGEARGVNDLGTIVGNIRDTSGIRYAAYWTSVDAMGAYVQDGSGFAGRASDVNNNQRIVGDAGADYFTWQPYYWDIGSGAARTDLGFLTNGDVPGTYGWTAAISDNSTPLIVGASHAGNLNGWGYSDQRKHAVAWDPSDAIIDLTPQSSLDTWAHDINNNNEIVGEQSVYEPNGNTPRNLSILSVLEADQNGIANYVSYNLLGLIPEADQKIPSIGQDGWQFYKATGINTHTEIVGLGLLNGEWHAYFLVQPANVQVAQTTQGTTARSISARNISSTFELEVWNDGPGRAFDVAVSNELPANVTAKNISIDQGACEVKEAFLDCQIGTLNVGQRVNAQVTIESDQTSGQLEIKSKVAAANTSALPDSNNEESVIVKVEVPNLQVPETNDPDPVDNDPVEEDGAADKATETVVGSSGSSAVGCTLGAGQARDPSLLFLILFALFGLYRQRLIRNH
jgi:hypothetical protein